MPAKFIIQMTKHGKCLLIGTVFFIFLIGLPGTIQAQVPNADVSPDDPDAPIDGGVSLLLAAGIGYGIKKARDHQKKRTTHLL